MRCKFSWINKMAALIHLKRKIKDWLYIHFKTKIKPFKGSEAYWQNRYNEGKNSGSGSYNQLAHFKAQFINDFVQQHQINSVIELGCGDGNQLKLSNYPNYHGFDISEKAVEMCRSLFRDDPSKKFDTMEMLDNQKSELLLSLDVIYHLVEDAVFETYMTQLFNASSSFVIIYSSNTDEQQKLQAPHVRHRNFSRWIEKNFTEWKLYAHKPNEFPFEGDDTKGSLADFYVYKKKQ